MTNVIDVFKSGSYVAYRDGSGPVQLDIVDRVVNFGDIVAVSTGTEVIIEFSSGQVIYFANSSNTEEDTKNHSNRVFNMFLSALKQKYPEYYDNFNNQLINIEKDFKKRINKENPKVKRLNKYARRRLAAVGIVASLSMAGVLTYSLLHQAPVGITNPGDKQPYIGDNSTSVSTMYEEVNSNKKEDTVTTQSDIVGYDSQNNSYDISLNYELAYPETRELTMHPEYEIYLQKYSNEFHVDYNVMRGIALQENGSGYTGAAYGIMQIEDIWIGNEITAYNFEKGQVVKYNVYDSTSSMPPSGSYIDDAGYVVEYRDVNVPENNIMFACMVFQNCLTYTDENLMAAMQCYNFGFGNFDSALSNYSFASGQTREEILQDKLNLGWIDYLPFVGQGDPEYLAHVMQWLGEENKFVTINDDGSVCDTYNVRCRQRVR